MRFLVDKDIVQRLEAEPPLINDVPKPNDWWDRDSPVQPASIDLHVGAIYNPGVGETDKGGKNNPCTEFVLDSGHTVMVTTRENINFPDSIMAFGFPPARISSRGVLMTNPGHVDPGYTGNMRFTLINMGKEKFVIRKGDPVVTLLIAEIKTPKAAYRTRRTSTAPPSAPVFHELDRLGPDFLDVTARARSIAREEVRHAELNIKHAQWRAPIYAAVGAALLAGSINVGLAFLSPRWKEPLDNVESRIEVLSSQLNVADLNRRLAEIEVRLDTPTDALENE